MENALLISILFWTVISLVLGLVDGQTRPNLLGNYDVHVETHTRAFNDPDQGKQPPMRDKRECISERKSRRRAGGCVASDTLPRSRPRDREVGGACRRRRPARSERERITFSSSTAELSMRRLSADVAVLYARTSSAFDVAVTDHERKATPRRPK